MGSTHHISHAQQKPFLEAAKTSKQTSVFEPLAHNHWPSHLISFLLAIQLVHEAQCKFERCSWSPAGDDLPIHNNPTLSVATWEQIVNTNCLLDNSTYSHPLCFRAIIIKAVLADSRYDFVHDAENQEYQGEKGFKQKAVDYWRLAGYLS